MRHFKDWHRVRANVVNEGPVGNFFGNVAKGMARPLTGRYQQWANELNRPRNHQEAVNASRKQVPAFATRLGLTAQVAADNDLADALARIVAAREYGPKDDNDQNYPGGYVKEADLSYVWNSLQQPAKKNSPETIAQIKGIHRPKIIIDLAPVSNPNSLWNWNAEAWERQVANQARNASRTAGAAPGAPGAAPGTAPAYPPSGSPGSGGSGKIPSATTSDGGRAVANNMKVKYTDLKNKMATATTLSKRERKQIRDEMTVLSYLYKTYTGSDITL